MEQYNTGAHQSLGNLSLFEVFFGRNPYRQQVLVVDDKNMLHFQDKGYINKSIIASQFERCHAIREKAKNASKKAADVMVLRSKREFPPSEYDVNEELKHGYRYF